MSKGPGRVQRAILALIAAEPDGAWSFEELCGLIYPPGERIERAQLLSVGRALKRMTLPGTWTTCSFSGDRRWWLCDPCNLASMRKAHPSWRDATPLKQIEMQIESAQTHIALLSMGLQGGDVALISADLRKAAERIKKLQSQRAELQARR